MHEAQPLLLARWRQLPGMCCSLAFPQPQDTLADSRRQVVLGQLALSIWQVALGLQPQGSHVSP